jgi:hypothetical protein
MDSKIIVKETCLTCNAGADAVTVDNTKAIEFIRQLKELTPALSKVDISNKTATEKHSFHFMKSIHSAVVSQDPMSKTLILSEVKNCPSCNGEGHIEKAFDMSKAFTTMLSAALQDPDFIAKNSELLKKLIPSSGNNGSST